MLCRKPRVMRACIPWYTILKPSSFASKVEMTLGDGAMPLVPDNMRCRAFDLVREATKRSSISLRAPPTQTATGKVRCRPDLENTRAARQALL